MKKKLFIHIGAHKTGTTSIQAALNSPLLEEKGFLYPKRGRFDDFNHSNVAWQFVNDGRYNSVYGGIEEVIDEIEQSTSEIVILSGEEFEYLEEKAISELSKALGERYDTHIVCYLRRQDKLILSEYVEWLKQGITTDSLQAFWRYQMTLPRYKYDELWDMWAKYFDSERFIFRPFDKRFLVNGDVLDDFAHQVGLPESVFLKQEQVNQSPSALAVFAMRYALVYWESYFGQQVNTYSPGDEPENYNALRYEMTEAVILLAQKYDTLKEKFYGYLLYEQYDLLWAASESNSRFFKKLSPELGGDFWSAFSVEDEEIILQKPVRIPCELLEEIHDLVRHIQSEHFVNS